MSGKSGKSGKVTKMPRSKVEKENTLLSSVLSHQQALVQHAGRLSTQERLTSMILHLLSSKGVCSPDDIAAAAPRFGLNYTPPEAAPEAPEAAPDAAPEAGNGG